MHPHFSRAEEEARLNEPSNLWGRQAAQWQRLTTPARPCRHDLAFIEGVVAEWAARRGAPRVLLLGVTPEMAGLAWPAGTDLLAVDCCADMIRHVWPGFPRPGEGALCADWLRLPLDVGSRDLVLGDGPFGVLRYPDDHRQLVAGVCRVLGGNGLFLTRVFVRPEVAEDPAAILDDLMARRIGNFQTFKFRLAMALHGATSLGVQVRDVWDFWTRHGPRPADLAARLGWPPEQIATIEAYRDQAAVYYFPTFGEVHSLLEEKFANVRGWLPPYELGDRCPTFVCARQRAQPGERTSGGAP